LIFYNKTNKSLGGIETNKIKSKDVARKLNISPATVSLVLNNKPGVSEKTRELVLSYLAEEKGMIQVAAKPQYHIALVILKNYDLAPDNPGFWQLFDSISAQCPKYQCDFCSLTIEKEDPHLEKLEQYDGIIVWGIQASKEDLVRIRSLKVPAVIVCNEWDSDNQDTVISKHRRAVFGAVSYLVERGHQNIGYLRGNQPLNVFQLRYQLFQNAIVHYGLKLKEDWIYAVDPTSIESSCQDFGQMIRSDLPTAFFGDNDLVAIGCMRALLEAGYRVPEDISIIGFGNIPISSVVTPSLTTFHEDAKKTGECALDLLMKRIADPDSDSVKVEVGTHLIARESVLNLSK
jgi:DNA-binding LacI/PurR family transcriptional regulator